MTPYLADPDVTLYHGDCLDVLRQQPDASVDCCVTSPPYWGLRDYGQDGQLGLERTPDEYVARLVELFGEVRRVLRPAGTLWLNLGDSYSHRGNGSRDPEKWPKQSRNDHRVEHAKTRGGKPKDLLGIPWRVAFALQADGWWLRSDIVWSKPNPMPESVKDRPTKSHEYVFLLAKSESYYFGQEDLREPAAWERWGDQTTPKHNGTDTGAGWIQSRPKAHLRVRNHGGRTDGYTVGAGGAGFEPHPGGRNVRSVWTIPTEPYPGAHFAVFPQALARRCILGGTPGGGRCPECGALWVWDTVCWLPSCRCVVREPSGVGMSLPSPVPCTVLDPFAGSGTTLFVARCFGRHAVGIELNEDYCRLAAERLAQLSLLSEGSA